MCMFLFYYNIVRVICMTNEFKISSPHITLTLDQADPKLISVLSITHVPYSNKKTHMR